MAAQRAVVFMRGFAQPVDDRAFNFGGDSAVGGCACRSVVVAAIIKPAKQKAGVHPQCSTMADE
jgi:hypothetical protein